MLNKHIPEKIIGGVIDIVQNHKNKPAQGSNQIQGNFQQSQANFQQNQANFQQNQANYQQNQANYQQNQVNLQQNQGNFQQNQGNFQQNQGNFQQNQGNFQQNQGNLVQNQGNYVQNQGNYQQSSGNYQQNFNQNQGYQPQSYPQQWIPPANNNYPQQQVQGQGQFSYSPNQSGHHTGNQQQTNQIQGQFITQGQYQQGSWTSNGSGGSGPICVCQTLSKPQQIYSDEPVTTETVTKKPSVGGKMN